MDEFDQRTLCQVCGKRYEHLGSHVSKAHKMTAREYKEEFGLDYKFSLISPEVRKKKQDRFEERREFYLKNFLKEGEKWQFKKGHDARKIKRVSKQSIKRIIQQAKDINQNARGECPVCKIVFEHMESHLFNKHRLIQVKGGDKE